MDSNQVEQLIVLNADKIPAYGLNNVRALLEGMDYCEGCILMTQLKDPTIAIILSVLIGTLGVDRFYIGDIGMSVGKLITCGGLGIWWIIDIFLIMNATREKNYERLMMIGSRRF